ncbi:OmpA/MotB family protein [Kordiimonas laminariae]|uniref:OmpA/MotB family protein n=1 Tax=Kordiimonas laminariae TaxID=2917717 RepID=UPI001FF5039E|nr:flagellar motor protein MotB [Kordiimonas laminariae]MCK0070461.1 OmpA family protein [Kordiimonas laminariae]
MKKNVQDEVSSASWMVTFADLLSLLLTFFVLMFSVSSVRQETWQNVIDSMARQFNPERNVSRVTPNEAAKELQRNPTAGLNLTYLRESMEQMLENFPGFEGTEVIRHGDEVLVSFPAEMFFQRKDIELVPDAERSLRALAGTLVQIRNSIRVAGHTDAVPVSSGKFRSNWELSMARARIVAGALTEYGYSKPITVLGYADTQENLSYRKDLANSERVDIVIRAEESSKGPYDLF